MSKREQTPNVMDELLGSANQAKAKPTPIVPTESPVQDAPKTKLTIYVNPDSNDELDLLRIKLRKIIKPESLHTVSKSTILEAALAIALRDFEANGENSQIAVLLSKR